MGFLAIIGVIYIIIRLIAEAWDNAGTPRQLDISKMYKDSVSGMSSRDFNRSYRKGKYFK